MTQRTIRVTGGAGFIGSALVRRLIRETRFRVVRVDKLTISGNLESLEGVLKDPLHHFEMADICDGRTMSRVFQEYSPDVVFHLVVRDLSGGAPRSPGSLLRPWSGPLRPQ